MPDPFNRAKMTGDTHPPEVESDLPSEEGSADAAGMGGTPSDRGRAAESGREHKPSRGVKKAGVRQDGDTTTDRDANSAADTGRGTGARRG